LDVVVEGWVFENNIRNVQPAVKWHLQAFLSPLAAAKIYDVTLFLGLSVISTQILTSD
jgi:hypothetical protein